jgi:hypothetical protein
MTADALHLQPSCPDCGTTLVARVRSRRTGRDYLAEFENGEPAPWLPHFRACRPKERAAILTLLQSMGMLKAREIAENLRAFNGTEIALEIVRLLNEGVLTTDDKHFWLAGEAPVVPAGAPAAVLEAGYYQRAGQVYKVQIARGSGNPYAKALGIDGRFAYAPGAVRELRPEHRVTLEQAREWGKINGRCLICGRELTNPESIEYGIGPVCRTRI